MSEIFPGEAVIERPENCPPLPLRDEKSFQTFNEFLKDKVVFSQFVSIIDFFGYCIFGYYYLYCILFYIVYFLQYMNLSSYKFSIYFFL